MTTENQSNPSPVEKISKDLDALKQSRKETSEATEVNVPHGAAKGAVDFLSATAVCSLLGYGADYLLHSFPWGMIVGLLVGVGVGAKIMLRDVEGK